LPAFVTTYFTPLGATVALGSERPDESASFTVLKTGAPVDDAVAGIVADARERAATPKPANRTFGLTMV
jgi:hypothetical protein